MGMPSSGTLSALRTTMGTAARGAAARTRSQTRKAWAAAAAGQVFPDIPTAARVPGSVWAVTMVKNEIDVLPAVLDHLETQGVDRVVVADNGSSDGTQEFLAERAAADRLYLVRDTEPGYYQAAKMTRLARWAGRRGADWIVPFDADEFWYAREGRLADALAAGPGDVRVARMYNVFPRDGGGWGLDRSPQRHGKVAFRAHRLARLGQGNHEVDRPGARPDGATPSLRIAHLPWRSFEQFAGKVRQGASAYAAAAVDPRLGSHWRDLGGRDDAALTDAWSRLLRGEELPDLHWTPRGHLVDVDLAAWDTWDPDGVLGPDDGAAFANWDR